MFDDVTDYKKKVEEFGPEKLKELVEAGNYGGGERHQKLLEEHKEFFGEDFKLVYSERSEGSGDWDGWTWRWQYGDSPDAVKNRYFEVHGCYGSYSGSELYDIMDLVEVAPRQVTATVWEVVE